VSVCLYGPAFSALILLGIRKGISNVRNTAEDFLQTFIDHGPLANPCKCVCQCRNNKKTVVTSLKDEQNSTAYFTKQRQENITNWDFLTVYGLPPQVRQWRRCWSPIQEYP